MNQIHSFKSKVYLKKNVRSLIYAVLLLQTRIFESTQHHKTTKEKNRTSRWELLILQNAKQYYTTRLLNLLFRCSTDMLWAQE